MTILVAFLAIAFLAALFAVPATWMLMLALGNITTLHLGFWALFPGVLALKMIFSDTTVSK